ncbi:unnamed protein product [Citrullus colocynthis]|uniref:Uncharacterized protein n=1 Tax=Citrullus colocynthis TaxID=252529 RepID=A0ABP0Z1C6_9ROSI
MGIVGLLVNTGRSFWPLRSFSHELMTLENLSRRSCSCSELHGVQQVPLYQRRLSFEFVADSFQLQRHLVLVQNKLNETVTSRSTLPFSCLNFLVTENRQREIVDPQCEGVQSETLDALLRLAIQCVSSSPDDRPTMHRVVQFFESEVMTPCPSDFDDSNSD